MAANRLREIAGPDLYRRNPFRVVGLATNAKPAQVRAQRHLLLGALDLGSGGVAGDRRLPLPRPPSAQEVRTAFDSLERPDHRLVDELFWWWGEPGACGCPAEVHEEHDAAVEAHAKALDAETDEELWVDAADAWMDALDHPGFWDHVRHRTAALSDRRMDESTVDGLRAALPKALLAPQVALAGTEPALADLLDAWDLPAAVLDDARRTAAEPASRRIDELVDEVHSLLRTEVVHVAADRVDELPALADLLDRLAPHERYRWSAKQRNRVAVMLNNCGLALKSADRYRSADLLERALSYVVEESDRATIADNLAAAPAPSWPAVDLGRQGGTTRSPGYPVRTPDPLLPARWPSNLAVFALYVAAMTICVTGLLGAPTWVSVIATVLFSWAPMGVITSDWYRSLMSDVATFVVGGLAFVLGWSVVSSTPWDVLARFLWPGVAFSLVSPFVYALFADRQDRG
ncbi:hypothetical protein SAMN05216188_105202 [Lentzea xinjiangensis]|uniref:Uncharacterized protein n=1 Tax=Lentzea xinjiangensis TaxID=402600 RepID=A0A1H9J462_9PSEU|nr:hypothetical protein SAMN05216188_105202 [Lentzea xinjiangensis]